MSEPSSRRKVVAALVATHVAALGAGYVVAPKEPVDKVVKHKGFFQITTSKVLATTVDSLRDENKLLVFSYKGSAKVAANTTVLWLFGGRQELWVPATVNYYIDLSDLSLADVSYNDTAKLVTVKLPKLSLGDIAFQPEQAATSNSGSLTYSDAQVEALRKFNYAAARRAMVAQAQQPGLVKAAKQQAIDNIQSFFEIPLRIAGKPDVKVVATFQ